MQFDTEGLDQRLSELDDLQKLKEAQRLKEEADRKKEEILNRFARTPDTITPKEHILRSLGQEQPEDSDNIIRVPESSEKLQEEIMKNRFKKLQQLRGK